MWGGGESLAKTQKLSYTAKMETITLTRTDKGIVVGGKTYDVKDILRTAGARWDYAQSVWIFRGADDIQHIKNTLCDAVEDCVAAQRKREAWLKAEEKAYAEWLNSDAGRAFIAAKARRAVAACVGKPGFHWICCKECVVIDERRRHTSCDACAVDGNAFFVDGRLRTGD